MPFSTYRADEVGTIECLTTAPAIAGAYTTLRFRITAGRYGIDDGGGVKLSWRQTSDMGKPQTGDPAAAGYARIEAAPDRWFKLDVTRDNIRPWKNTLYIRVGRFLMPGESFELILGCTEHGGPGIRMQTNAETGFNLRTFVDAFATYDFVELAGFPKLDIVPGPVETYRMVLPTEIPASAEHANLRVVGLDRWGNPSGEHLPDLTLLASVGGKTSTAQYQPDDSSLVTSLSLPAPAEGEELRAEVRNGQGTVLGVSNPGVGVKNGRPQPLWADLHGQSGETVGSGTLAEYYAFAAGPGLLDATCHQGNDFQMTDADWAEVNRLSKLHDEPGRFIALPGYEWSGNTGVGGDHNVICLHEGEEIHRSSSVLLPEGSFDTATEAPTLADLFNVLEPERFCVLAHVGGRYAMISPNDDLSLQRAVEVHSCWGTFEWILHDAFDAGQRVGVVAHSDDHKGRPGCAWPGASTFGALGGLTCYLADSFDRKGLLDALRRRHTYGTTGNRIRLDLSVSGAGATFRQHVSPDRSDEPAEVTQLTMGDIAFTAAGSVELTFDVSCPGPIEKLELFDGAECIDAWIHPLSAPLETDRIRVLAEGALYRGRGRILNWNIEVAASGTTIQEAHTINVFNRDRSPVLGGDRRSVSLETVTTGNRSGMDITLSDAMSGRLKLSCELGEVDVELAQFPSGDEVELTGEGLGRRIRVQRLPSALSETRATGRFAVDLADGIERRLLLRVTQDDGHIAWSSPVYLERVANS